MIQNALFSVTFQMWLRVFSIVLSSEVAVTSRNIVASMPMRARPTFSMNERR